MPKPTGTGGPDPPPRPVAIGTSAGGLKALGTLLGALPADFPAPILVVQHLSADRESHLAALLERGCPLRVAQAVDGESVRPGHVYIAPPGQHMVVVAGGGIHLTGEPEVRFSRPSVDVLFESMARTYGAAGIAVVLTGGGSDGALGARAVKDAGGTVLVQDRSEAQTTGMPAAAVRSGAADHELSLEALARALVRLQQGNPAT